MIAADIGDFRELARRRLPHFLFEYVDGGAFAETTLNRNLTDLRAIALRQRVMRDVSGIDLSTTILGEKVAMPVALAPIGLAGMAARRGEVQAARAAQAAGVPFTLSMMSCCPVEEVRAGVGRPFWFQLYLMRDRGFAETMLARAQAAGTTTLLLTVDLPTHSMRYRELRSGMAGPQDLPVKIRRAVEALRHPHWLWDVGMLGRPHTLGNVASMMEHGAEMTRFVAWVRRNVDATLTWKDVEWVRARWPGKLVVKGVLDPADAVSAIGAGADGVLVSNHGGRQLDGALSTIAALPAVVEAVAGRVPVLMDGGVRSGLDVVRAMALGASGVLLGRAWAFALAARGGAGVAQMLELVRREMIVAMALTGCTRVSRIGRDTLVQAGVQAA
ncbi:MAG: L-lactate dehydrogenase [Sphingomonas sp.]